MEELRQEGVIIKEGNANIIAEDKKPHRRYLFLFPGALLITKATKTNNRKYKLIERIEWHDLSVTSIPDVNQRKNFFKISKNTFVTKTKEDRESNYFHFHLFFGSFLNSFHFERLDSRNLKDCQGSSDERDGLWSSSRGSTWKREENSARHPKDCPTVR